MTTTRKCLEQAIEAYKDTFPKQHIRGVYDQLERYRQQALDQRALRASDLMRFANAQIRNEEQSLLAREVQQLTDMQAVNDTLQLIQIFHDKGIEQPVEKAIISKITGSKFAFERARENTDTSMVRAGTTFIRQFTGDMTDDEFITFNSLDHQVDLAENILKINRGEDVSDDAVGGLAKVIKRYQDRYINKLREYGIDVNELESRVMANVHSQDRILRLSREERDQAGTTEAEKYDFLRRRWIDYTLPLLDKKKTFIDRNIDITDSKRIDEFMSEAFDNLVNKGKVTQENVNVANKVKQPRVLHWKDGKSLVAYNDRFGAGSIQDAVLNELQYGFSRIELIKDWGVTPKTTLDRVFRVVEENPELKKRFGKAPELRRARQYMDSLLTPYDGYGGKAGDIANALTKWEYMTKLGFVTLTSISDLALLGTEAANLGLNNFEAVGNALSSFVTGMDEQRISQFKDMVDTARSHKFGMYSRYFIGSQRFRLGQEKEGGLAFANALADKGVQLMHQLNGLQRWDNALRAEVAALISRFFAMNSHKTWDSLPERDQATLKRYNISAPEYEVIRNAKQKVYGNKHFITPDMMADVPDEQVIQALKEQGSKNINKLRIKQFKDDLESKLRDYIQDRQDHVILRPDVADREILSFGIPKEKHVLRAMMRMMTVFKSYGLAFIRKPLMEMLYKNGATNWREAISMGKGNWRGIASLTTQMMAYSYASMTLKNALQNLSPPSLRSSKTWTDMLQESLGLAGVAFQLNPYDFSGSLERSLMGAPIRDADKLIRFGAHGLSDTIGNVTGEKSDFSATNRAFYAFAHNNIPLLKQAYSISALNSLLFNQWQEAADPGSRDRYLAKLEQEQGVTPMF